uniref:Uncharacterized protein n=1 Tax=Zea mays TaxID=4577 RepID=C0PLZ1_MAIZE|nr:unknown [Zea mays]
MPPQCLCPHSPSVLSLPSVITILLLDQAPGEKQADDHETQAYGSPEHNGYSLCCLLPSGAAAVGHAVGVVAVADVALVEVDLAGGRAAALDLDVLHGLGDALAAVPRGEVALALRHGVDGLVAGGDEAAGAGGDAALERGEGGVPAHLEVAAAAAAAGAAGLEEHLDAGDLGEAGHLVEREAAGELDPRGDGGAADAGPGGHGAGDAGGAVGGREVPAALEEAEDGGGQEEEPASSANAHLATGVLGISRPRLPALALSALLYHCPLPPRHGGGGGGDGVECTGVESGDWT